MDSVVSLSTLAMMPYRGVLTESGLKLQSTVKSFVAKPRHLNNMMHAREYLLILTYW